jgi:hypothetical protein
MNEKGLGKSKGGWVTTVGDLIQHISTAPKGWLGLESTCTSRAEMIQGL